MNDYKTFFKHLDEETKPEKKTGRKYCGVLLDEKSKNKLLKAFKDKFSEDWTIKCHHMTIDPFGEFKDETKLGSSVNLMVTFFGIDDKACAVKVTGCKEKTNNKFAHVTIAVNEKNGGQAKDSNEIQDWTPVKEHILLTGTIENLS